MLMNLIFLINGYPRAAAGDHAGRRLIKDLHFLKIDAPKKAHIHGHIGNLSALQVIRLP
jgi:hypothetical protein